MVIGVKRVKCTAYCDHEFFVASPTYVPSTRLLESAAIAINTLLTRNIEPGSSSPGTATSDSIMNSAPAAIAALAIASRTRRAPPARCVGRPAAPRRPTGPSCPRSPSTAASQPEPHEFQVHLGAADAVPASRVGQHPTGHDGAQESGHTPLQAADLGADPAPAAAAFGAAGVLPRCLGCLGDDLAGVDALELLAAAPDLASAARLSTRQISAALTWARRRQIADKAEVIRAVLRTEQLGQPEVITAAYAATVRAHGHPGHPVGTDQDPAGPVRGAFWPAPGR
jgi:hypothetical protein